MSTRASARHRTPARALTPLTELTDTLTDRAQTLGRTGVIMAMSSGLVTTLSLPAGAVPRPTPTTSGSTTVNPDDAETVDPQLTSPDGTSLTGSTTSTGNTPAALTASPQARVSFERSGRESGLTATRTRPASDTTAEGQDQASPRVSRSSRGTVAAASQGSSVIGVAARYVGTPYRYGGTTPSGFDCSGFVQYVFAQFGHSLPRTAHQQMNATRRISRSEARPGDLVFFVSGGRAYHNGIYAGDGMMYDSPRSGKTLQLRSIWSSAVVFTRVTG
jgi:cell wall-associated NlpC family hydrolase